jgi:glycerate-2-kinase
MLLQASPQNEASEFALRIYEKTLQQVSADRLVREAVQVVASDLYIQGHRVDMGAFSSVLVCGAGKASIPMGRELCRLLGHRCSGGLLVTKDVEEPHDLPLEVIRGGHPIPDEGSLIAGERMMQLARSATEDQLVLFVLSGGASALMELPAEGLSLEDLQVANQALLRSGADITAINAVRSRISQVKAGGLAKAFAPATVICLVLSDVVGNDLHAIGSAPLLAPRRESEPRADLVALMPPSVQKEIGYPHFATVAPHVDHVVIGSVSLAIHEAAAAARELGLKALPYADPLKGEARVMARRIVREAAHQIATQDAPFCMIFGGETTVTVRGQGLGGRCQEMAVAAALQVSKLGNVCFLAAGTDGNDGPTIAAGGFVDEQSCARAHAQGQSVRSALRSNHSFAFLQACDGLVITGPTGSNLNDLVLVVRTD